MCSGRLPSRIETCHNVVWEKRAECPERGIMFRIPSLTIVFALVASAALAQSLPPQPPPPAGMGMPGNQQERDACRPDVMKFCKELLPADEKVQADTVAIANCLFANQKKVSSGCNRVLTGHPQ